MRNSGHFICQENVLVYFNETTVGMYQVNMTDTSNGFKCELFVTKSEFTALLHCVFSDDYESWEYSYHRLMVERVQKDIDAQADIQKKFTINLTP